MSNGEAQSLAGTLAGIFDASWTRGALDADCANVVVAAVRGRGNRKEDVGALGELLRRDLGAWTLPALAEFEKAFGPSLNLLTEGQRALFGNGGNGAHPLASEPAQAGPAADELPSIRILVAEPGDSPALRRLDALLVGVQRHMGQPVVSTEFTLAAIDAARIIVAALGAGFESSGVYATVADYALERPQIVWDSYGQAAKELHRGSFDLAAALVRLTTEYHRRGGDRGMTGEGVLRIGPADARPTREGDLLDALLLGMARALEIKRFIVDTEIDPSYAAVIAKAAVRAGFKDEIALSVIEGYTAGIEGFFDRLPREADGLKESGDAAGAAILYRLAALHHARGGDEEAAAAMEISAADILAAGAFKLASPEFGKADTAEAQRAYERALYGAADPAGDSDGSIIAGLALQRLRLLAGGQLPRLFGFEIGHAGNGTGGPSGGGVPSLDSGGAGAPGAAPAGAAASPASSVPRWLRTAAAGGGDEGEADRMVLNLLLGGSRLRRGLAERVAAKFPVVWDEAVTKAPSLVRKVLAEVEGVARSGAPSAMAFASTLIQRLAEIKRGEQGVAGPPAPVRAMIFAFSPWPSVNAGGAVPIAAIAAQQGAAAAFQGKPAAMRFLPLSTAPAAILRPVGAGM